MLRYRVYQLVTHPQFPKYAYWASWVAFLALFWALWSLPQLAGKVFISENALSPGFQGHHVTMQKGPAPTYQGSLIAYLMESFPGADIESYPPSKPTTYSFLYRSPRAIGYECMALVFPLHEGDQSSVELASGLYRYIQQEHQWLGKNILFLFYKAKVPYSKPVRDWLAGYFMFDDPQPRYYGLIRLALVIDVGANCDYITVLHGAYYIDGINGQQVDVDLLAVSTRILEGSSSGVPLVHPEPANLHPDLKHLAHVVGSWQKIVEGNVHSPHSYFLQYYITQPNLLVAMEQFLRTVTGLEEQLHAGYYFYFLAKPDYFLPLSKYAYFTLCAILPLLFHAVLLLKDRKEDAKSLFLVLLSFLPATVTVLTRYIWYSDCDSASIPSPYTSLILSTLVILLPLRPHDWVYFKGISSVVTGLAVVSLTLYFFPLGLAAGVAFAPLKIAVRPVPGPKVVKLALALGLVAVVTTADCLDTFWESEKCSGHKVWTALQLTVLPSVLQLLQLSLTPLPKSP